MLPELRDLVENLAWFDRRRVVDQPIALLTSAWQARFDAQSRYIIRRGLPYLRSVKESEDDAIAKALAALAAFKFKAADKALEAGVSIVFKGGGDQSALDIGVSYLTGDDAVLRYLKLHGAEKLAADVDDTTRKLVRAKLVQSFEDKWTYNRTVKEIRALFAGFSATAPQAHIRNRAELIAVNELGNAYSAGSLFVGRDLKSQGYAIEKAWALAANPCPMCQGNAAQGWIDIDKVFSSGHDAPCGHPACRCSLTTRTAPPT